MRSASLWAVAAVALWTAPAAAETDADVEAGPGNEPVVTYSVQPGDTLLGIAGRHNTSLTDLMSLNPQVADPDRIRPEQQLFLAAPAGSDADSGIISCELLEVAEAEGISLSTLPVAAIEPATTAAPDPSAVDPVASADESAATAGEGAAEPEDSPPAVPDDGFVATAFIFSDRLSEQFLRKVAEVSRRLEMDPNHLLAIMHYETGGSFRPSIRNRYSQAVGLIQFLPATARRLGTTDETLERMTAVEQLDWVERYMSHFRGRLVTLDDAYMAVLYPAAVGRQPEFVLFSRGSNSYRINPGLDRDDDGHVTKGEVGAAVRRVLETALAEL